MADPLLEVTGLYKSFDGATAVDNVSFTVSESETLGIVGESGSGKSVTALSILDLLPSTATIGGDIYWKGTSINGLNEQDLQGIRGNQIGMIFP